MFEHFTEKFYDMHAHKPNKIGLGCHEQFEVFQYLIAFIIL